ncbi:TPA: AAA family ATPase, partial [Streptococcus equi subsp. zooepidemicus]|nr:AAA family ATPase [Streptococcus equi subsp. zooepidemicus]
MYLSELRIKNFRWFDESNHIIKFNKGLNVLVGENDSGKSAIIDSIRYVLGTTDMTWNRLSPEEFYNENTSLEIEIICKFQDFSIEEKAAFIECLSYEGVEREIECLYINWKGSYLNTYNPPRTITRMATGKDGNGNILSSEARELLRVTYLHALRDAYSEMSSGKNSRLSRVMQNISNIDTGNDIYNRGDDLEDLSVLGIANLSNDLLAKHKILSAVNLDMTSIIKEKMLLETDSFTTKLEVAGSNLNDKRKVMSLLEKLDLTVDKDSSSLMGRVGLGTSNVMSMACELLLHKDTKSNNKPCFLLIEEPEAHIHAQRQLKLIESLEDDSETNNIQVILTTHSPLLASVVKLSNVIFVKKGKTYSLSKEYTNLDEDDYVYLEKYLDATKSNLFFARSVVIVEGPGEALLLPTIAKLLGCSFTNYGVSLIDVRSTGLRRYARIFQRKNDGELLDINV